MTGYDIWWSRGYSPFLDCREHIYNTQYVSIVEYDDDWVWLMMESWLLTFCFVIFWTVAVTSSASCVERDEGFWTDFKWNKPFLNQWLCRKWASYRLLFNVFYLKRSFIFDVIIYLLWKKILILEKSKKDRLTWAFEQGSYSWSFCSKELVSGYA